MIGSLATSLTNHFLLLRLPGLLLILKVTLVELAEEGYTLRLRGRRTWCFRLVTSGIMPRSSVWLCWAISEGM